MPRSDSSTTSRWFDGAPDAGASDPVYCDTPRYEALDWETAKSSIEKAEELSFDAAWVPDHLMLGRDHAEYECWHSSR